VSIGAATSQAGVVNARRVVFFCFGEENPMYRVLYTTNSILSIVR
jgi:hypothetical protein